jgi:RND family efflux transporter MFP subunit
MTRARSILPALTAAVVASGAANALAQNGPPAAKVVLDEARLEVVQQWREVTGDLRAIRRSTLASEAEGLVMELLIDPGDAVKAGQPIARLKDTLATFSADSAAAALQQQRATVTLRQAELAKAERDLTQTREIASRGGAKQNEVADAETAVDAAQARLAEAEAEAASAEAFLAEARERLENTVISAPFDGFIVGEHTEVGQWVREGDPVAEIVQTDIVEAWLDVPERFIAAISSTEATVQLRIEALGEVREAQVTAIVPLADELSRLFPVRVRMENPDGLLRPGMSVTGLVPTGASVESLTVHKDAVLRNDAGTYVYFARQVPGGGLISEVAPVQVLFAAGERVAVRSPVLAGGEQVVIEGNERMFPGQPLRPVGGAPAADGAASAADGAGPQAARTSTSQDKGD